MTETTTSSKTMAQIDIAVAAMDEAKKIYQETCGKLFKSYLQEIFQEHPKLDIIWIIGWTPGFNDGDVCRHSTEFCISEGDIGDQGKDIEELREALGIGLDEKGEWIEDYPINDLSKDDLSSIRQNLWKFDDYLQARYDTDFQITISRKGKNKDEIALPDNWEQMTTEDRQTYELEDGQRSIKIEHDHYDCGY